MVMTEQHEYRDEAIAVVGSSCRFAGDVTSTSKLWDLLHRPVDVLSKIPSTRFDAEKYYHPDPLHSGTSNVRHSYLLSDDHRVFDAPFFRVKPVEAAAIDPQQRLLLETTYEALECAGIPMEHIQGSNTGVWVGLMGEEYSRSIEKDLQNLPTYFASGTARNNISNRISYFFDLHGPSLTIDTACSSSLVALHQAVTSLRSGEVGSALVAGANLLLGPEQYIASSKLKMLSPSGRSRMWDKDADGYARGDGFAVLVLKKLSDALAAGDHIECVIRETGVNQDGRTKGITMPSSRAQADLIKATYERAGLDLSVLLNRPQFFEAHGTGTPAGDPIEAEAIDAVFFGPQSGFTREHSDPPLYVGSVKTVLGHTEGTAGILGVLKASLALQHGKIPPNMLLNELSPSVQPFYTNLQIPQGAASLDWPTIPLNCPRRASVNSFGFGGTNAHVILESFQSPKSLDDENIDRSWDGPPLTPFNFSAGSETALRVSLGAYASFLQEHPSVNLRDLAWTLNTRRSTLTTRASIYARNSDDLRTKLELVSLRINPTDNEIAPLNLTAPAVSTIATPKAERKILAIFTGQGAQWAGMGQRLVRESPFVESCFDALQKSLDGLPQIHAPNWRLKDLDTSRIGEAGVSQPLCTAVQIALVQLLRAAGIDFAAVVGHSSGEIAAAYAAGYLSAEDAIRVAYYRGLCLEASDAHSGAMLAVGTTHQDAEELCALPSLKGRICIAARNSPNSVTLSGDIDAIQDAEEIMEDEGKFAKRLRVDRAYHSHHMQECALEYVQHLAKCHIDIFHGALSQSDDDRAKFKPLWISSVTARSSKSLDASYLRGMYWADNMCKPVLFSQALEEALISHGPFDSMIEVGPHPALQRPVSDTVEAIMGHPSTVPYVGTLSRGKDDVESFAKALGILWQHGIPVDFGAVDRALYSYFQSAAVVRYRAPKLVTGLPTYSWDHDRVYWHDSRRARSLRVRGRGDLDQSRSEVNSLLGVRCPDITEKEYRFRNHLTTRGFPWLADHRIQGQIVLPAAAYICAAIEAIRRVWPPEELELIELRDLFIRKAVIFPEPEGEFDAGAASGSGVETFLSLIISSESPERIDASFSFCTCPDTDIEATQLVENCTGQVVVTRGTSGAGDGCESLLPTPSLPSISTQLLPLPPSTFYDWARNLGYGYEGGFRGVSEIKRKVNEATGVLDMDSENTGGMISPATLDCAIQAILLAYSCPGDGRMRSLHMPTKIDCLRFDLMAFRDVQTTIESHSGILDLRLPFYASAAPSSDLTGDVEIHDIEGHRTLIQMQGLQATPLGPHTASNDVSLFFDTIFGPERPDKSTTVFASTFIEDLNSSSSEHALCTAAERVACYYLRKIGAAFPPSMRDGLEPHHNRLLNYVDNCLGRVEDNAHPYAAPEWLSDSHDDIIAMIASYDTIIDFKIIKSVGESLPQTIETSGAVSILGAMTRDNMLTEYYLHGLGMPNYLSEMARTIGQLGHRFPQMDILEIGAGTGAATSSILAQLKGLFRSYTYTDISSSFLKDAEAKFSSRNEPQMSFRTLDIEVPATQQGYNEASYDLIVASLALHATKDLEVSLANVRRLLRPGGYLVMLELTDADSLRVGLIFGGLPGWWVGSDADGRQLSPCVSCDIWDSALCITGFSNAEVIVPNDIKLPVPLSVIICQALDERVGVLLDPLANSGRIRGLESLTIIGTGPIVDGLCETMEQHYEKVMCVETLADAVASEMLGAGGSVISLADADPEKPAVFESLSAIELSAVQQLFKLRGAVLWISWGCRAARPFANMFRGLRRSAALELVDTRVQTLDFETADQVEQTIVATKMLQLEAYRAFDEAGRLKDVLWYCEPEVFVEHGRTLIPRLRQSSLRNKRFNSTRRFVSEEVKVTDLLLTIGSENSSLLVVQENGCSPKTTIGGGIRLRSSLLRPICIGSSAGYLSLGTSVDNGQSVIVLSGCLGSTVNAPSAWTLPAPQSCDQGLKVMKALHDQLIARRMLEEATASRKNRFLVVLDPEPSLGETIRRIATDEGARLILLTTRVRGCTMPWYYLHPRETAQRIRQILPTGPFTFVDMLAEGRSEISGLIRKHLPRNCTQMEASDFLSDHADLDLSPVGMRRISDHLQAAWLHLDRGFGDEYFKPGNGEWERQLDLDELTMGGSSSLALGTTHQVLLRWEARENVRIRVQPASARVHFLPNKTYWLVGLTGGLGLSTALWMAEHGAQHIALSSRNPRVDPEWIDFMSSRGCAVRVFANDIVKRESVQALYRKINSTMPPVAGVAQGAMVLHDVVFPELDINRLQKTLGPKVQGSLFLNELFPEDTLDFFVFFSSMAYVVGNRGQSAYTAANAFMASLAAQRRQHGLAASVINIGGIVGEGYVSRQLAAGKQSALAKAGFEFMSEQAFHELFAEGVLASRAVEGQGNFEISSGLRVGEGEGTSFANNPIFQSLVSKTNSLAAGSGTDTMNKAALPLKARLLEATSANQVNNIIKDGLLMKLQATLHVELDRESGLNSSPDQLGVDSLVAVDIQSWFLKELGVDLPVMRILNSTTITQLVCFAEGMLPPDKTPGLGPRNVTSRVNSPKALPQDNTSQPVDEIPDIEVKELATWDDMSSSLASSSSSGTSTPSEVSGPGNTDETASMISTADLSPTPAKSHNYLEFSRSVPMSFSQSRFWFLSLASSDQCAFNVTTLIRLQGNIDHEKLAKALVAVVQRHEAIRTAFYLDPVTHQHMQGILPQSPLHLECSTVTREEQVQLAVREMEDRTFELSKGVLLGLKLLSFPGNKSHVLVLGYHHIAVDGIGNQVFLSDLESAYHGRLLGGDGVDGEGMLQYPDFTLRQLHQYERGSWSEQLSYWRRQFSSPPRILPLLVLSQQLARPSNPAYLSHKAQARVDPQLKLRIKQICKQHHITPFHFYLSVFGVLLFRYGRADEPVDDICIGVADGGRKDPDILRSLGLFLNLLPLRFRQSADQTFVEALRQVKMMSDEAFTNSRPPIDVIFNELKVQRSPSYSPLFQAFMNYRPHISDSRPLCGCEAEGELISGGETAYDITLDVLDSSSGDNKLAISVNSALYTLEDAQLLQRSYLCLLREFASNPVMRIARPPLHPAEDVAAGLQLGQGPEVSRSLWPATVIHRIDEMATTYHDNTALTDGVRSGLRFTYGQMTHRSNIVASHLLSLLGPQDHTGVVGVFQMPGPEWVCSFLGVLRAGAPCVPLDREVGLARLLTIARDCRPKVILVDATTREETEFLRSTGSIVFDISEAETAFSDGYGESSIPFCNRAEPSGLAVITYTSGSTGAPKGSVIQHAAYRNFAEFAPPRWALTEGDEVVLQQSSYAFDLSVGEIFICLAYGGTLIVPDDTKRRDPEAIVDLIISERITMTVATPTEYLAWLRCNGSAQGETLSGSRWRRAITAGESVMPSLVQEFINLGHARPDFRLINVYGPSEATIGCADGLIPLTLSQNGSNQRVMRSVSPLPNYSIAIVDEKMDPVPAGVVGQIVIGGAGVARGYLNYRETSAPAFVPNHFASEFFTSQGWLFAHLSGDLGRLDRTGRVQLHGRIQGSTQIKIAGVRMDLQEIENVVLTTLAPYGREVVVSHRKNTESSGYPNTGEHGYLVGFVVLSQPTGSGVDAESWPTVGAHIDSSAILKELSRKLTLPHIMRPAVFVALEAIPKTVSGKVDRAAIDAMPINFPEPLSDNSGGEEDTATNSAFTKMEEELRLLWAEVLPNDVVTRQKASGDAVKDRTVDFFQLGGSSLSLITLQALIKSRFQKKVPIHNLFGASTLGQMAMLLEGFDNAKSGTTVPIEDIDWDEETAVPTDISSLMNSSQPHKPSSKTFSHQSQHEGAVVVLTGSTGFLGSQILRRLIQDPSVARVHCVAVRKPLAEVGRDAEKSSKVMAYKGNLSIPQLGLSDQDAAAVFSLADAVIHCAANVSFMETYHSLRAPNVVATKELVRLTLRHAASGAVPVFHYVSTASVVRLSGADACGPVSMRAHQPPRGGSEGYVGSKWASEVFLERAAQFGLPVLIHRPSSIMGVGSPQNDLMGNMLQYAALTRTVPDVAAWKGSLDFVSVENVAGTLLGEVMGGKSKAEDGRGKGSRSTASLGVRYLYESGDVVIGLGELADAVKVGLGEDASTVRVLPMREWVDAAEEAGMHPLLATYLRSIGDDARLSFPRLILE